MIDMVDLFFTVLLVILLVTFAESQVTPLSYNYSGGMSENGSYATANCSTSTVSSGNYTYTCEDPPSSVLFDDPGGLPTLTGLDGDMWASQLLTIQRPSADSMTPEIQFNFASSFTRVQRVEMVMFNCPQWGIGVQTIRLLQGGTLTQTFNPTITSCDSLVRLCLRVASTIPALGLQFTLPPISDWVHLAEVTFYGTGMCQTDAILPTSSLAPTPINIPQFTTSSPVTITDLLTTTAMHNTPTLDAVPPINMDISTTANFSTGTMTTPATMANSSTIVIVIVLLLFLFLLLLVVMLVTTFLILWRCKHHKHHYTAKEEASHTTSHTHPAVSLCEETGQLQYASDQDNPSHTYSTLESGQMELKNVSELARDTAVDQLYAQVEERNVPEVETPADHMYSSVDINKAAERTAGEVVNSPSSATSTSQPPEVADQLYSQVDETKKVTADCTSTPQDPGPSDQLYKTKLSEMDTTCTVDQLYSQVNKTKKRKIMTEEETILKAEVPGPIDQLYAQVNKPKKKTKTSADKAVTSPSSVPASSQPPELEREPPVDQLYAQVDKKKRNTEKKVCPEESGAVYSVVNKPSPPQLPPKSQELLEEFRSIL